MDTWQITPVLNLNICKHLRCACNGDLRAPVPGCTYTSGTWCSSCNAESLCTVSQRLIPKACKETSPGSTDWGQQQDEKQYPAFTTGMFFPMLAPLQPFFTRGAAGMTCTCTELPMRKWLVLQPQQQCHCPCHQPATCAELQTGCSEHRGSFPSSRVGGGEMSDPSSPLSASHLLHRS